METIHYCQSCGLPIDDRELQGWEKDASRNADYCKYCYQNGQFTQPNLTLEEMKTNVKTRMEAMNTDADLIDLTVSILPNLKRWRKAETVLL